MEKIVYIVVYDHQDFKEAQKFKLLGTLDCLTPLKTRDATKGDDVKSRTMDNNGNK